MELFDFSLYKRESIFGRYTFTIINGKANILSLNLKESILTMARGCAEICKKCRFMFWVAGFKGVECRFGVLFNLKTF